MQFRIVNVLLFAFLFAATAVGDPTTLHIGSGFGTPCATGGCPIFGTEVNAVGPDLLSVHQTSGAPKIIDPLWLIFGVPNDSSGSVLNASSIGPLTLYHDGASTPLTSISFAGFVTSMDPGEEVYGLLGVGMTANNSNSFTNWSAAVSALFGFTPGNFGIYKYVIDISPGIFDGKDFVDVGLNGIPLGTFAVAYGIGEDGTEWGTPFTESGIVTPEPTSLLLLGTGLLGLGRLCRKKQKKA